MSGTKARHYFEKGYLCAESVLLAGAEALKIDNPAIPAIATGFCSGISRTKGPCGALMGAILLINLKYGRSTPEQDLEHCYELVQTLSEWFESKFGSTNCYKITGCDFLDDMDRIKFKQNNLKESICFQLVEQTTDFTVNLLQSN